MQRAQADLDAEASIMLKPEIAPPLPKPLTMPRPPNSKKSTNLGKVLNQWMLFLIKLILALLSSVLL